MPSPFISWHRWCLLPEFVGRRRQTRNGNGVRKKAGCAEPAFAMTITSARSNSGGGFGETTAQFWIRNPRVSADTRQSQLSRTVGESIPDCLKREDTRGGTLTGLHDIFRPSRSLEIINSARPKRKGASIQSASSTSERKHWGRRRGGVLGSLQSIPAYNPVKIPLQCFYPKAPPRVRENVVTLIGADRPRRFHLFFLLPPTRVVAAVSFFFSLMYVATFSFAFTLQSTFLTCVVGFSSRSLASS